MTGRLLKAKEAAAYLGVHVNTLKRWNIPHYVLNHRGDQRYEVEVLDQWLSARARNVGMEPSTSTVPNTARARTATQVAASFTVRRVR